MSRFQVPVTVQGVFPTDYKDPASGRHYDYTRIGVRVNQDKGFGFTETVYKYGTHQSCAEFKDIPFPAELILDVELSNDGGMKVYGWRPVKPAQQAPKQG